MRDIIDCISGLPAFSNVLVICKPGQILSDIIERFLTHRINIIGPATSAQLALLLAAQTPLDLAVIDPQFESVPAGLALARRLHEDWGVATVIAPPAGQSAPAWDA